MNKRETATVLAALRHWQSSDGGECGPIDQVVVEFANSVPGDGVTCLNSAEIDALCERINFAGDPSIIQQAAMKHLDRMLHIAANHEIDDEMKVEIVHLFDALFDDGVDLNVDTNLIAELRDDVEAALELKF